MSSSALQPWLKGGPEFFFVVGIPLVDELSLLLCLLVELVCDDSESITCPPLECPACDVPAFCCVVEVQQEGQELLESMQDSICSCSVLQDAFEWARINQIAAIWV